MESLQISLESVTLTIGNDIVGIGTLNVGQSFIEWLDGEDQRRWNFTDVVTHAKISKYTKSQIMCQIKDETTGEVFFVFFMLSDDAFICPLYDALSKGILHNPDPEQCERLDLLIDVNSDFEDQGDLWDC